MRVLRWLHRWLGVTAGLVMALWCLSGFVMMYVSYPYFGDAERWPTLPPLSAQGCCVLPAEALPADTLLAGWSVRMLGATPVLRVAPDFRAHGVLDAPAAFNLATGARLETLDATQAATAARDYGRARGITAEPAFERTLAYDQWTVQGIRGRAPLHKFAFGDAARTEVYVSSSSGEVLQATTRRVRFWNWLGAVPHWLYPTVLRANGALWSEVVIWTSVVGTVLTVLGVWLGIVRLGQRRRGRLSPYRGLWEWHHVSGLIFGVLTLTWLVSGLLSMNPWGLLEGRSGPEERRALAGAALGWQRWSADLGHAVARIGEQMPGVVELRSAPLAGEPFIVAANARGERRRFDVRGEPAPLGVPELQRAIAVLGDDEGAPELLAEGDDYFYRHKSNAVPLPVYRAQLAGPEAVSVYLDPVGGGVLLAVDGAQRQYRWWHSALHRLDFRGIRARPLWDLVVLTLLAGVTVVCVTGVWLSWRVLRR
jgi:uncharacterized iron-regulated membrane protein